MIHGEINYQILLRFRQEKTWAFRGRHAGEKKTTATEVKGHYDQHLFKKKLSFVTLHISRVLKSTNLSPQSRLFE